jgi:hypothetical protein
MKTEYRGPRLYLTEIHDREATFRAFREAG